MKNKLPWEKGKFILTHMATAEEKGDFSLNVQRKIKWFSPTKIQRDLKRLGIVAMEQPEVTSFLVHYEKLGLVISQEPETQAKSEYSITQKGIDLLEEIRTKPDLSSFFTFRYDRKKSKKSDNNISESDD